MKYLTKAYFLVIGSSRPIFSMFVLHMVFLVFGAMAFLSVERKHEEETIKERLETFQNARNMVNNLRDANYSDIEIHDAFYAQHYITSGEGLSTIGWEKHFADKVLFAFILLSTIGYGNVGSTSVLGQSVIIVYTAFGIPILMTTTRLYGIVFRDLLSILLKIRQELYPTSKLLLVVLGSWFYLIWLTVFIFTPAYIFMITEDWEYFTSVYYSLVTLTTIGLGDYVAGLSCKLEDSYIMEMIGLLAWMFFGLGFISMCLNLLSYVIGLYTLDKLECRCKGRTAAKKKMKALIALINETERQLAEYTPETFQNMDDIEFFRNILTGDPQNVTQEMLFQLLDVTIELKKSASDNLSALNLTEMEKKIAIRESREQMPDIDKLSVSQSKILSF